MSAGHITFKNGIRNPTLHNITKKQLTMVDRKRCFFFSINKIILNSVALLFSPPTAELLLTIHKLYYILHF